MTWLKNSSQRFEFDLSSYFIGGPAKLFRDEDASFVVGMMQFRAKGLDSTTNAQEQLQSDETLPVKARAVDRTSYQRPPDKSRQCCTGWHFALLKINNDVRLWLRAAHQYISRSRFLQRFRLICDRTGNQTKI